MKPLRWPATTFFVIAYVWSWIWWIPVVYKLSTIGNSPWNASPNWILPFVLLGAYGPTISAIVLTWYSAGWLGLKNLLSKYLIWRASIVVYLVALFSPIAFLSIAMLLDPESTTALGKADWAQLSSIPLVLLMALPFGPLAEELGWRGYALSHLQKNYSALVSSLIIGVLWCFWHTPLFWAPAGTIVSGNEVTFIAVGKYLFFACGLSIIFTWIVNNSKGSVLLPIIFHVVINSSIPLILFSNRSAAATTEIKWMSIIPAWVFAFILIGIYGYKHLSKSERVTNEEVQTN